MQIKLTQLISELGINKPNHTPEEVYKYYNDYILNNYWECDIEDCDKMDLMWKEFKDLKYDILNIINISLNKLKLANQKQLNIFYRGMKDLVNKYNLPYNSDDLNELQINKPPQSLSMLLKSEVDKYFNKYFIEVLNKNSEFINEDVWYDLPKYYDKIKDIMSRDNQFDHNQFDDESIEEYFNLNMLSDVKKKLWKKYFENVDINKIKKQVYVYIQKQYDELGGRGKSNYDVEADLKWYFRYYFMDSAFDDVYPPYIVEPFIDEIIYETIKEYEPENNLDELQINNPNPTAEEVGDYFNKNINGNIVFNIYSSAWVSFMEIKNKYIDQHGLKTYLSSIETIEALPQLARNQFFKEMKQLVQKYATNNI